MKIYPNQLAQTLKKQSASIFLLSGDEPLLMQESADLIRHHAKQNGFIDRQVFSVGTGFDWASLQYESQNLSLFSTQRLIELRLSSTKIGDAGSKALSHYTEQAPKDIILLIITPKFDAKTQKTKWVKAINKIGLFIQVWPIEREDLPQWITNRCKQADIPHNRELVSLLVNRAEGNLLAAKQEIDKLALLAQTNSLDINTAAKTIMQSSRYTIFDLVSAALQGNAPRALKIIQTLQEEKIEMTLTLWAIAQELRVIVSIQCEKQQKSMTEIFREKGVWNKRQKDIQAYLTRHKPENTQAQLQLCAKLDKIVKGYTMDNPWDLLTEIVCQITGKTIIKQRTSQNA